MVAASISYGYGLDHIWLRPRFDHIWLQALLDAEEKAKAEGKPLPGEE